MKTLIVTDDKEKVTSVSQTHLVGKTNSNVEVIDFTDQTMYYMPQNIQSFFSNIKGLTIYTSKLRELRRKDIAPFPNLMFLYVPYNEITTVDGNLFASNLNMEYISFSSNRIMVHVGYSILKPLKNLKEVHFSDCNCINKNVQVPSLVDQISLALAISCPPTMEMLEQQLLEGENFSVEVKGKVAEETKALKAEIDDLKNRLTELEKIVREIQNRP